MNVKSRIESLHLSPSIYHGAMMKGLSPALAFPGGAVLPWQKALRRKLRERIGAMPVERCALRPRRIWFQEHPLGTIEKIAFTSEPYSDVTAYVCLPRSARPPYTFMICLQGHSTGVHNSIAVNREDETLPLKVEGDRDFGLGCMKRGVAALCIEQRSFGERRELNQKKVGTHGCHDATMHALMLGKTLAGERVFDVDRGIDYLAVRGDADLRRIGVMGNSGGGTVSVYAAALLPRIAFAMPSCSFCTYRDSIMSIYHCMDNYIPGLLPVAEMADVMGLFAPKPVVVVAGQKDEIFPIAAVRRAFRDLKEIYSACGAGDRCHLVVGKEGHRFYADAAWPVMMREIQKIK
ncbi:MAG: alpha/beta hydrolase family protein [Kiritimatiellia bacterium]|nr:alpha/beta hydrolase family protein [Kiritimatiellia bacterium]